MDSSTTVWATVMTYALPPSLRLSTMLQCVSGTSARPVRRDAFSTLRNGSCPITSWSVIAKDYSAETSFETISGGPITSSLMKRRRTTSDMMMRDDIPRVPAVGRTCMWFGLIALAACVGRCNCEVYTSTAQLDQVLRIEREVVVVLDEYVRKAELKLDKIRNYVRDYEVMMSEEDETWTADNPLHAYQLMKRLAIDWVHVENALKDGDWWRSLNDVKERRAVLTMPEENDLLGAAMAIIRLKQTYNLNVTDLSRGILQGISTATQLTARDCLYLGRNTLRTGSHEQAVEWLEQAMILAGREDNQTVAQEEILPYLQEAMVLSDEVQNKKSNYDSSYLNDHFAAGKFDLNVADGKTATQSEPKYRLGLDTGIADHDKNFEALCRGEKLRPAEYEAKLKCFYRNGPHPFLRLRRVKTEENHLDPMVLTFHDVIYDNEISLIQMLAGPNLQRSTVVGTNGVWRQVSDTRTSQNTWIYDSTVQEQPILQMLQHRMHWLTNLHVSNEYEAEALQVANYGVGGHYIPHHDYLFQDKTPEEMAGVDTIDMHLGDRLATFMFYMSDVSRGGATVFPKMGVSVWPRKGSAAFWFNLKRSGHGDQMTLHGACPVLHGSKWVGNKWIRENAQMFVHSCGLTPYE